VFLTLKSYSECDAMPTTPKSEQWNKEVLAFLDRHFPNSPNYKASLVTLWEKYLALGLPNAHFVSQFTSGKKEVVFQRAWEMMVARHLDAQGHHLTTSDEGPDFRFERENLTVWVEAISPEPKGLPAHWMEGPKPNEFKVGDFPHNEILLRWTSAFKEKWEKLGKYQEAGIVGEKDAYVIAINGCQLGALPLHHGISRYPFAVEAVYCVGPVAININRNTGQMGKAFVTIRTNIQNANGASVPTSPFVDPTYSGVSAIMALTKDRSDDAILPIDVIHNHFARVPVANGVLGSTGDEWVTEAVGTAGEEINLRKLETVDATA
jgi:type I restriction enzyme S subunit